jgi:soluble lytic murein transglycosylase-like protein
MWRQINILVDSRQRVTNIPYADIINRYAISENLNPKLVAGLIQSESSFQPHAVSNTGAVGLMQIMPNTWRQIQQQTRICSARHNGDCTTECYYNPEVNIRVGTAYLSQLVNRYQGNKVLALAAYNAGPGAVDKYNSVPPYPETEAYVERVLNYCYETKVPGRDLVERLSFIQRTALILFVITIIIALWVALLLKRYCRSWRWR